MGMQRIAKKITNMQPGIKCKYCGKEISIGEVCFWSAPWVYVIAPWEVSEESFNYSHLTCMNGHAVELDTRPSNSSKGGVTVDDPIQIIANEIVKLKKYEWDKLKTVVDRAFSSEAVKVELSDPESLKKRLASEFSL